MDDTISRAAALEVINAVKGVTWSQSGKVLCGKMYSQIKDLPAVDAIPVEWLNKQCEMADDRGDMEMTDAISWLIQTWQKEQEAR